MAKVKSNEPLRPLEVVCVRQLLVLVRRSSPPMIHAFGFALTRRERIATLFPARQSATRAHSMEMHCSSSSTNTSISAASFLAAGVRLRIAVLGSDLVGVVAAISALELSIIKPETCGSWSQLMLCSVSKAGVRVCQQPTS